MYVSRISFTFSRKSKAFSLYSYFQLTSNFQPRGPMDKASDYESGDSRFKSWRSRLFFSFACFFSYVVVSRLD